jgi:VanZ family protein
MLTRKRWLACGMGWVALVVYLSLTPDPVRAPTVQDFELGHVIAYLWLMFWFAQLWKSTSRRLGIAVAFCLLGVALEYLQGMTGCRTFSYSDMLHNALGVLLGLGLSYTPLSIRLR